MRPRAGRRAGFWSGDERKCRSQFDHRRPRAGRRRPGAGGFRIPSTALAVRLAPPRGALSATGLPAELGRCRPPWLAAGAPSYCVRSRPPASGEVPRLRREDDGTVPIGAESAHDARRSAVTATRQRDDAVPAEPDGGSRIRGQMARMTAMETLAAAPWRWVRTHPRLVDAGVAIALALLALPTLTGGHGPRGEQGDDVVTTVLLVLAAVPLVVRRRYPVPVWALTLLLGVLAVLTSNGHLLLPLPTFLALYTVGRLAPLRTTVLTAAVTGVAFVAATVVVQGAWLDERGDFPALTTLALSGAAAAVGVAVRNQHAALAAARARAQQAELTREEEAQRRVTDERVRIARELHDVVAHHISVVNVQAGVARHLMDSHPDQARMALSAVRDASKTVLSEMSAVVGLLRTPEEHAPTAPAPGLERLGALAESARLAGLALTWTVTGEPYELPPVHDLTAYRVVQEALTNAAKYGAGAADLVIDYGPDAVHVDVRNPVGASPLASTGDGHGLIGMRERVEAVRGRLVTGPTADGAFTVHAEIPRSSA